MVAIKVLRTDLAGDASFQQRFRRESRVAARLQEPHVIPVHDFGDIDGVLYIDMRLVEGASLKDELRVNGALPPARTVSIIGQVAAALDAAHASGLVHRDIKPENVLLTPDDFTYLVDFGIAHGGGEASVTSTGLVIGSAAYMATERLSGGSGGPASDVYSLTCLLYECLTGRPPFEAGDVRQPRGHARLTPKTQLEARIRCDVGAQHLDRHHPLSHGVVRTVDLAHATDADQRLPLIGSELRAQSRADLRGAHLRTFHPYGTLHRDRAGHQSRRWYS
jgi:serine/threonine protein kinase